MLRPLTEKENKFVMELLKPDVSQREAYKRAYNAKNMKDSTIDNKACLLLKKEKVRVRYEELRKELEKEAEKEGLLSANDVLKGIAKIIEDNKGSDDKIALKGYELLGKHHKLFTDKVEHSGTIENKVVIIDDI